MLRIASAILLLATVCTANAQQINSNEKPTRIWAGSHGNSVVFKDPGGEVTGSGSAVDTGLSYQFNDNMFSSIRYAKNTIDFLEINAERIDIDETSTAKILGFGYRLARANSIGNYFGAAYYHNMDAEDDESSGKISIFMEKDNHRRFGRLGLSRETKDATGTQLSGTHVWFLQSGLGLGLQWSFAAGTDPADPADPAAFGGEVDYTVTNAGLLLMYRI